MKLPRRLPTCPTFLGHARPRAVAAVAACVLTVSCTSDGGQDPDPSSATTITTLNNEDSEDTTEITNEAPADAIGPNQSAEDAARDGIVPALAELALRDRMEPLFELVVGDETWVASELATQGQTQGQTEGCVGDVEGENGTDFVCGDYAEVLQLDKFGQLQRAFAMQENTPTWIATDTTTIFVGHVGDAGQPYSTLTRIDRTSLKIQTWVLPLHEAARVQDEPEYPDRERTAAGSEWTHGTQTQAEAFSQSMSEPIKLRQPPEPTAAGLWDIAVDVADLALAFTFD